jgi:iron complex transport system substrate-binding protein
LDPVYSGFLASALAISDGAERREIESFALYEAWCRAVAAHIAKMEVKELGAYLDSGLLPEPLAMAMNAIFTGVAAGGLLTPGNQP